MKKYFILFLMGVMGQAQATTMTAAGGAGTFDIWGQTWDVFYENPNGGDSTYPFYPDAGLIQYDNNDGTMDDLDADTVKITGSNDYTGLFTTTEMTTQNTLGVDALVSFNWSYSTTDIDAFDDRFNFITDLFASPSVGKIEISDPLGPNYQPDNPIYTGSYSATILAGAIFGFSMDTLTDLGGAGIVTLSNFGFAAANPSPVPLPPAFLLFGAALAGLGFVRRRKAAATAV